VTAAALVIEDDADIRALLQALVERMGWRAVSAATGEAGLAAAAADPPALVLLDILLPDIDGWEVARRLRAADATAAVPILVVSILDPPHNVAGPGLHVSVSKPFTAAAVRAAIGELFPDADQPQGAGGDGPAPV